MPTFKFVNETIVGEVIVDKMNQTNIYFYVIKFMPVLIPPLKQIIVHNTANAIWNVIVFYVSILSKHSGLGAVLVNLLDYFKGLSNGCF